MLWAELQWQVCSVHHYLKGTRSPPGNTLSHMHTRIPPTHTHTYDVCVFRVVCELQPSGRQRVGPVLVTVRTTPPGRSTQNFTYQVRVCPGWGHLGSDRLPDAVQFAALHSVLRTRSSWIWFRIKVQYLEEPD